MIGDGIWVQIILEYKINFWKLNGGSYNLWHWRKFCQSFLIYPEVIDGFSWVTLLGLIFARINFRED